MNHDKQQMTSKYSNLAIGALADAFDKSIATIQRWVKENDDRLTSEKAKRVLEKFQMVQHEEAA